jgi:hypothetical protein
MNLTRPAPVIAPLARTREPVRAKPLKRAPYRIVKRLRMEDALVELAVGACAQHAEDNERLGEMWEAAYDFMNRNAQRMVVQRSGPLMTSARAVLRMRLDEIPEESHDHLFAQPAPETADEVLNGKLATAWIEDRLTEMSGRDRCFMRNALGLDGTPVRAEEVAKAHNVSVSYYWLIVNRMVRDLNTAWRRDLRDANLLLEYGDTVIEAAAELVSDHQPVRRTRPPAPPSASSPSAFRCRHIRKEAAHPVRCEDGVMTVHGVTIRRVGAERYVIGDGPAVDADEVARVVIGAIPDEAPDLKRYISMISRRDTAIADSIRWTMSKAAWPTPVARRLFLPLTEITR